MLKIRLLLVVLICWCLPSLAYRIEGGEYFAGGGFGVNVNVARFNDPPKIKPRAQLPLIMNVDYAIDKNIGVFGSLIPLFSSESVAFLIRAGAKYWLTDLDIPFIPYASLALTPSFFIPGGAPNHFNIGISPGIGANYFVLAKLLVGAHVNFDPSMAFADGDKKFEFSVMSYFDVTYKI
jgi:hypothetical protein